MQPAAFMLKHIVRSSYNGFLKITPDKGAELGVMLTRLECKTYVPTEANIRAHLWVLL